MSAQLVLGYDPGGTGSHGVARLLVPVDGKAPEIATATVETAEAALRWFHANVGGNAVSALGVDTLTAWSTGHAGFRPADRYLQQRYPKVRNSIISSNSLYGAMAVNGMAVALKMRQRWPAIELVEAHPKVMFHALSEKPLAYDFNGAALAMNQRLAGWIGTAHRPESEHEFDALLSALAALKGLTGEWRLDLHAEKTVEDESLVFPCGKTQFWWPE